MFNRIVRSSSISRLSRAMSTSSWNKYPFLAQLGLTPDHPTTFNGKWVNTTSTSTIESVNPVTGEVIATLKTSTEAEYETCMKNMEAAKKKWADLPMPVRGEIVRKIGVELRKHKDNLGALVSLEVGKILSEGCGEVQEAIDICDYAAGLSRVIAGQILPSERPGHVILERWNPLIGNVAVITAFNFPCAVYFWNAALSLVCGNTNIWKGSQTTPLTTIACMKIVADVLERENIDPAIVTMVTGTGAIGEVMVRDPRNELISFTGSTKVGRIVSEITGQRFAKKILELGGNNCMIVLEDADLSLALRACVFAAVGTAGQRCTTLRRLLVHKNIYDDFIAQVKKAYGSVKIGDPLADGVLCGPLHTKRAVQEFAAQVENAKKQGGKVLFGGNVLTNMGNGNFVEPTIIEISHDAQCVKEEVFAPILYVTKIDNLDDAIAMNNSVPQGLASALFTTNQSAIFKWTGPLGSDCGIVNVNIGTSGAEITGAFGGEKETGGGRESGSDSWKQYMRRTTATINYSKDLPLAQGVKFDI